ncbi:MAG: sugar phosphate isomerase/epimerase [Kiritimatiellae bacterium]|nr:sugar phosphate isomerase/epimerase [Kiritimatiellia bacterium]
MTKASRRDFFKGAAAIAALGGLANRDAIAHAAKPKARNNPIWLMTSAFPDDDFDGVVKRTIDLGAQGLELCVFAKDTNRSDHIATHLDYNDFTPEKAKYVIDTCNRTGLRISVGAYQNLIGGEESYQIKNQDHILKLIRIAAMLGGDANDVVCGTFVGYDQTLGRTDGGFEKNLYKFKKVFTPILKYAKDLGVTVCVENCPMEGWVPGSSPDCYCNLPGCLAARKLMYAILDDSSNLQETYDPSHDIWQHIDPSDVLNAMDFKKLRRVHIKGTRNFTNDEEAVNWGRLFPIQRVDPALAKKAGVPVLAPDEKGGNWDRLNYEPRLPGFGGNDSCDWTKFLETLMAKGYSRPLVIENEGCNSSHTGNMGATMQGFKATILNTAPVVWPLAADGYQFDKKTLTPMKLPATGNLPVMTMAKLNG